MIVLVFDILLITFMIISFGLIVVPGMMFLALLFSDMVNIIWDRIGEWLDK